ncbi:MAG TPA: hypothetical protein VIU61_28300 [Kofleriaceae bacterium]
MTARGGIPYQPTVALRVLLRGGPLLDVELDQRLSRCDLRLPGPLDRRDKLLGAVLEVRFVEEQEVRRDHENRSADHDRQQHADTHRRSTF